MKGISWADTDIAPQYPDIDCGAFVWKLIMTDLSPIDTAVFSLDNPTDPRSLKAWTNDRLKAGLYSFTIKISLQDYPTNPGASKNFTVLVENKCEDSMDITVPSPPADATYTVARPSVQTYFDEF